MTGAEGHHAYSRRMPAAWTDDDPPRMLYAPATGPPIFELICRDCGDDEGPYELQSTTVQLVRGPYRNVFMIQEALRRHNA